MPGRDEPNFGRYALLIGALNPRSHSSEIARKPHPPNGEMVEPESGSVYSAPGMLMEYAAHRVVDAVSAVTPIPVELTAVKVPDQAGGHEAISLDISE